MESVRETLGSLTWAPALAVAKPAIEAVFTRIEVGTLLLIDEPTGRRLLYGQKAAGGGGLKVADDNVSAPQTNGGSKADHKTGNAVGPPRVELVVKRDAFWMRLLLFADMGFAEAFMLGDFECADLTAFFKVSQIPSSLRKCHIQGCSTLSRLVEFPVPELADVCPRSSSSSTGSSWGMEPRVSRRYLVP
jgi:hypothetical protein